MEKFLKDVQEHVMTIENDNSIHRCLHFAVPGSSSLYFRLITWPDHLAISGDMGDFVFRRIKDMFRFFRGEGINPSYWGEKLTSISTLSGYKEFDWDKYLSELEEYLIGHNDELDPEFVKDELQDKLWAVDEDEYGAVELIRNWHHDEIKLDPCDLSTEKDYTYQYIWCLRAIVWGISQYDAHKEVINAKAG